MAKLSSILNEIEIGVTPEQIIDLIKDPDTVLKGYKPRVYERYRRLLRQFGWGKTDYDYVIDWLKNLDQKTLLKIYNAIIQYKKTEKLNEIEIKKIVLLLFGSMKYLGKKL